MNWEAPHNDPRVEFAFDVFRNFALGVATHYAGSRLLEQLDISSLGNDVGIAISDNFPERFTTIRTVGELSNSINTGEYGQLCLRLAVVNLCTAFEVFFDSIAEIYGVTVRSPADNVSVTDSGVSPYPLKIGNKTIMQIAKLHRHLSFDSVLNSEEVFVKLCSIIEVRNCIVHSGGRVSSAQKVQRLKSYGFRHSVGDILHLKDNQLDDFIHYIGIHIMGFVMKLPDVR